MVLSQTTKRPGDLLVHVESLEFCTKSVHIRNGAATPVTLANIVGYPLKASVTAGADYNLAVAGDEGAVTALLIDGPVGPSGEIIAATTIATGWYQALVHPPAVLNQDKLPALDFAGAAFNLATLRARLITLGYELRAEPTNYSQL